ncbi:tetratricopeptide repeat protein [Massilia sp. ST3]|uniref:tetratricopeptide repeat protein n=1 Tax=Massilia sp. ST3 TaxID=2824903 RepID=UPI001B834178|nr:SEL1-like repeat protein [Massilia sp. ST3]MBQ5947710.1 sel1 repeat family protein [Massilia sp. ST3]
MKRVLVTMLAALLLAQPAMAQHGDEGDSALRRGLAYRSNGDAALAAHWLSVAATRGVPEAMFILANMRLEGEGVARDEGEARRLLEEAAQMDYAEAWQQLALMEKDPVKAAQLMRRAAHALTHRGEGKR